MKKLIFIGIILLSFSGCAYTFKSHYLEISQYPEWINTAPFRNHFLGDTKKSAEYNHTNFIINHWRGRTPEESRLELFINPKIKWDILYIQEISYIKDGEKIYFTQNKYLEKRRYIRPTYYPWDSILLEIEYRDEPQYFKNMKFDETIEVQLTQIYKFDDNELIVEVVPYKISCYKRTYNPWHELAPNY